MLKKVQNIRVAQYSSPSYVRPPLLCVTTSLMWDHLSYVRSPLLCETTSLIGPDFKYTEIVKYN